jgi:spore germination cell wall hydrolase CwlJ-like protein
MGRGTTVPLLHTERKNMRSKSILIGVVLALSFLTAAITVRSEHKFIFDNVSYYSLSKPAQKQIDCLAENMYFEALSEPKDGQIAVALVTLNRLASGNYADDICGVVNQKTAGVCQFSWVCQPIFASKRLTIKHNPLYNDIRNLAVYVFMNYERMHDHTKGATFYHADYVNPGWRLPKTTKIGRHIFYKNSKDFITIDNKEIKL